MLKTLGVLAGVGGGAARSRSRSRSRRQPTPSRPGPSPNRGGPFPNRGGPSPTPGPSPKGGGPTPNRARPRSRFGPVPSGASVASRPDPGGVQQQSGPADAAVRARRKRRCAGVQQPGTAGHPAPGTGHTGTYAPVLASTDAHAGNCAEPFPACSDAVQPPAGAGHPDPQSRPGTRRDVLGRTTSASRAEASPGPGHAGVLVPGPARTGRNDAGSPRASPIPGPVPALPKIVPASVHGPIAVPAGPTVPKIVPVRTGASSRTAAVPDPGLVPAAVPKIVPGVPVPPFPAER